MISSSSSSSSRYIEIQDTRQNEPLKLAALQVAEGPECSYEELFLPKEKNWLYIPWESSVNYLSSDL